MKAMKWLLSTIFNRAIIYPFLKNYLSSNQLNTIQNKLGRLEEHRQASGSGSRSGTGKRKWREEVEAEAETETETGTKTEVERGKEEVEAERGSGKRKRKEEVGRQNLKTNCNYFVL